ncbi:hypothetical protein C7450_111202 [Chelatococcus asaccharovorans]|uniref:Uncharacterized protein n=1 Tax=Chelatococcus asaccharovorans TaxID=28210 RepID=A0A2V3TY09_9HYPH|nr:hypothetical protein C7450_111202 [Chelatococcus asaccharovorans]
MHSAVYRLSEGSPQFRKALLQVFDSFPGSACFILDWKRKNWIKILDTFDDLSRDFIKLFRKPGIVRGPLQKNNHDGVQCIGKQGIEMRVRPPVASVVFAHRSSALIARPAELI